jgi:hypothetical protein
MCHRSKIDELDHILHSKNKTHLQIVYSLNDYANCMLDQVIFTMHIHSCIYANNMF